MNRAEVYVDYFKTFYKLADDRCRAYWGTDKPNGQAAGLESLCAFAGQVVNLAFAKATRHGHLLLFAPDAEGLTVVDAGAGASSAILRTYFKNVISCDPDGDYLAQVQKACSEMGLPPGRWVTGIPDGEWDACFYDYGTSQRGPSFPTFLDRTRRLIWIDDAHDTDLVRVCGDAAKERSLVLKLQPQSVDEHGRYGALVRKA